MANSNSEKKEKFVFYWKIKNLCYSTKQNGEIIFSPTFTLPHFKETTWKLGLYPKGENSKSAELISCVLFRICDKGPEKVNIKLKINDFESDTIFSQNRGKGWGDFSAHDAVNKSSGMLVVVCELQHLDSPCSNSLKNSEEILPLSLKTDSNHVSSTLQKLNAQLDSYKCVINKKLFQYPSKSFAQTVFCSDKVMFESPLNIALITGNDLEQVFPVILSRKESSVIVTMRRNGEVDKNLTVELCLVNEKIEKSLLVVCQLSVLIDGTEFKHLSPEEHVFYTVTENEIWKLKQSIDISDFIPKLEGFVPNSASLKVEFTFAAGEVRSKVLWDENAEGADCAVLPCSVSILSNQMHRLYNEKKLCDVALKLENKTYEVHRVVLAAMSPVFSAMFDSDMVEKVTSTVDIVDLDEDTVGKLVDFMYRGTLDNLEFEEAKKLFSAADKYQIVPLMNLCRKCLMDNICVESVCEILSISDKHSDIKLKEACIRFICFYETVVLDSEEWKTVEKTNMVLAFEVLKKMVRALQAS